METFVRPSVTGGARTLPSQYYVSPAIFGAERERIWEREWVCVGRKERLPRAGDFFTVQVGNENLIVTRDARAAVHAFFNVCRHRGTRLCERPQGRFQGSIQCPYHAWTYRLDGALQAARNMAEVPGFDRADYPLKEAATASWEGFLFVNLAPGRDELPPQGFEELFAPLAERFASWEIARLRTARSIRYEVACNWKLVFLNYSECYHCPLVHPQLDRLSPSDSGRNDLTEGPFLGGYSEMRRPGTALTTTGTSLRPSLGNVAGADLDRSYYYTIFPSLLLSLHRDYVMVHYVTPLAVDRTEVVCAWLFDERTIADAHFDPSDAVEFWDVTNKQDWHVNELTQLGLRSRTYRPGPYSNAEGLLSAFDRHYRGILEAAQR